MSIASSIFTRFRSQRATATRPARQAYIEFLKELASGNECDLESLELCCASLGIDEAKLQQDIDSMAKRLQSAERLKDSAKAEPLLYETQAKIQRIAQEQREYLERTNAELHALKAQEIQYQTEFHSHIFARQTLRETVLDCDLLDRIAEHDKRRQALNSQQQAVEAELKAPFGCCWKVAEAERNLQNIREAKRDIHQTRRHEIPQWESQLRENLPAKQELERKLQAIRNHWRTLDAEQAEIEKAKLLP